MPSPPRVTRTTFGLTLVLPTTPSVRTCGPAGLSCVYAATCLLSMRPGGRADGVPWSRSPHRMASPQHAVDGRDPTPRRAERRTGAAPAACHARRVQLPVVWSLVLLVTAAW